MLTLESFQAGLSWITVLRKRPAFRAAFAGFDPQTVARFGAEDVERLLTDAGIIRNRAKIEAAVGNARAGSLTMGPPSKARTATMLPSASANSITCSASGNCTSFTM